MIPPIGPYHISVEGISMREELLYNLTDTSFFRFNLNRTTWSKRDSIYQDNITYTVFSGSNRGMHSKYFETLRFTNNISDLMQKDYTLPEKFPEYYTR
jgi:hypothetical protein